MATTRKSQAHSGVDPATGPTISAPPTGSPSQFGRKLTPTRPAETVAAGGSLGLLIAYVFGVRDPQTIIAIGTGIGLMPGAVTWLVDRTGLHGSIVANGGMRGVLRKLWRGA